MHDSTSTDCNPTAYELHFKSLFDEAPAYSFPCDVSGHVDMDSLSDRARNNYLYARVLVGRELSRPAVQRAASQ